MELRLFGARISPFVEKVARALEYKDLDFSLEAPSSPMDLKKKNAATQKMPVLFVDGEAVYDSTLILRRLEAIKPEPALYAIDPAAAAAQRLLEDWSDEALYWYLMALRWAPPNAARTAEQLKPMVPALMRPLAKPIFQRMIGGMTKAQGMGRLPYDVLFGEIRRVLDDLVLQLGKGPFFFSDRLSAADLAVYGELHFGTTGATPDFAGLVNERSALGEFMKRVEQATRQ